MNTWESVRNLCFKILENLHNNNVRYVHHLFRGACNYEPSKKADEFRKWQKKKGDKIFTVY
ncbi:MAG: hypothetical protein CM1200mP30_19500 [Pseudomonadota bacterium]|nr:MAG: hypothetical protein CM1200mP30_19500 [Pseudomonadota bacterium]